MRVGCQCPAVAGLPLLNSHTYNIALETNIYTCQHHRIIRKAERVLAAQVRKTMGTSRRLLRDQFGAIDVAATKLHDERNVYEYKSESLVGVTKTKVIHKTQC